MDRFGEGQFDKRVLVMYSGIHYDAIALTPSPDLPRDFDQTEFSVTDGDGIVEAAVNLASVWKQKRKFTDTANFTLKCGVCGKGWLDVDVPDLYLR